MAASATDHFTKVGAPGSATTLSAPGHTIGGTSLTVVSTSNWPTTTGVIFAMDTYTTVNGVEVRDVGSYTEWEGVVASGTSITGMVLRLGTDQNYPAGVTTRVYIPVAASQNDRMVDGLVVEHNQSGTHSSITASGTLAVTGATTLTGALTIKSYDDWITSTESWVYDSATTITVPTDATTKYQVGDFIKLTQSATVKYFQIVSLTSTVLTVFGLGGVTVANSAITANAYSHGERPFGVTGAWQSWTPTWTNLTVGNGTVVAKYTQVGKTVIAKIKFTMGTTSSMGTTPYFTTPNTMELSIAQSRIGIGYIEDLSVNGYEAVVYTVDSTHAGIIAVSTAGTYAQPVTFTSTIPITWGTGDIIAAQFSYEVA